MSFFRAGTAPALEACSWSAAQLPDALRQVAVRFRLPAPADSRIDSRGLDGSDLDAVHVWLDNAAEHFQLEAEVIGVAHSEARTALSRMVPAIWALPEGANRRFLVVVSARRGALELLEPGGTSVSFPLERVRTALCSVMERPHLEAVERLLDTAALRGARRCSVRRMLLTQIVGGFSLERVWLLRRHPSAGFARQLAAKGVPGLVLRIALCHLCAYALLLAAWNVLAQHGLNGPSDRSWFALWVLLLASTVPLEIIEGWAQGGLDVAFGEAFKQRLMLGALESPIDHVRTRGAGTLLGHVIESEVLQQLLGTGALTVAVALVELAALTIVLLQGVGGFAHGLLLALWLCAAAAAALVLFRLRRSWSGRRLALTGDLVEKMVGHRTRVVQVPPSDWHTGEDATLGGYLAASRRLDRVTAVLFTGLSKGWLIAAFALLGPILSAKQVNAALLAPALGATLLASGALSRLTNGLSALIDAAVAWRSVEPIFAAARQQVQLGMSELAGPARPRACNEPGSAAPCLPPLLEARNVRYRHSGRSAPVVCACDLSIADGDTILLEGASGAGKSSLVALLAGLRSPDEGSLSLRGIDHRTLGYRTWRRHVVLAPQFQENLVLTGTLAFNLLLGRAIPSPHDHADALEICQELGLGELLARMPSGLLQPVGESGWQLSHGEKSRVFIARTLLQDADLVVLDESFAALDPDNLARALDCARRRARTLLVVAHP